MKFPIRLIVYSLLLAFASAAMAQSQPAGPKIDRIDVKFVGPASVSEQFLRANIRAKAGDIYRPGSTQDDVHALYGTGQFYNIRIAAEQDADGGVVLTYIVQARPRVTDIKLDGNKKVSDSKLQKKITVKVGEPLDEQKLFNNVQEMKKLYQKYGYSDTQVKYVLNIDENTGHGSVTFQIVESPKVKISDIDFIGASMFKQKELRKQLKTSRRWMLSWLTGSGVFKQDDFADDRDTLVTYYRDRGYLDFEIKDVKFDHPTPNKLLIHFYVYEGRQYKVGSVKFTGNQAISLDDLQRGLKKLQNDSKTTVGTHGLAMDVGDTFTPGGLHKDIQAIEDLYGTKGYIDVAQGQNLHVIRIPNVDTGTMDLEFQIDEGQKNYVEKIDIRGNLKTKDKVLRRELAISPGEVFDMVRVRISQQRLEGLQYFDKVDLQPEPTDPPIAGRKNLVVNVSEQNTGNITFGAGFSSVDSLVGFVEVTQGNFDLFNAPTFTGGGQKARLKVQLGTQRQDYELSFIEPWFLNRKLSLGVDLYLHQLNFESPNNIFDETRMGTRVSLTRALWTDFFIGSVSYTVENVGISLNSPYHDDISVSGDPNQNPPPPDISPANVPRTILNEVGNNVYQRFGASLAYDTRNSTRLPNHGQRTEITTELDAGPKKYYKLELKTAWYFPGLFKGHVIEAVGRTGVADSLGGGDVPFYDRYYLGGLYSLRGFKYRNIAPREPGFVGVDEPIGGDSYWFGSLEYSVPIFEKDGGVSVRFAGFYDVGSVSASPYTVASELNDNWGLGLRLNIPHLGPLRLDYGIPIHHDKFNNSSGQFQFGIGYTREF